MERNRAPQKEKVVKAQWMEARVVVYTPDEISDEELARSNTIQKVREGSSDTLACAWRLCLCVL